MTSTAHAILEQALRLEPVERAELIDELFHSFDKQRDTRIDGLLAAESESRIDAFDAGLLTANPAEDVFERINKR